MWYLSQKAAILLILEPNSPVNHDLLAMKEQSIFVGLGLGRALSLEHICTLNSWRVIFCLLPQCAQYYL